MSVDPLGERELNELVDRLPASPRLLAELAPKLLQVEVPVTEITGLLRRDAGLTGRLIALANGAAYARAEPATSLEEAVSCIGYSEVYRLVGALAATQLSDAPLQLYGIDPHRFRENALFVALVMEELAGVADAEPKTAYTIGLLRSIGKVAFDRHARKAAANVTPLGDNQAMLNWERATFGTSNAEVASRVFSRWRFPQEIADSVRDHYTPGVSSTRMSHLLNIAAGAADLRGFGFRGEESYWQFTPESFARTGIDEGRLVWAGERAFRTLQRLTSALA